ncbi:Crp/Fnr family transcriptional regulator [Catenuloplanes indicus]|uniref:CRP-like cAMP-binding protein n=1 Tax=Catenuloplanes indicus TaxID=137267 RepID=A0AAE3W833_9ACTN|nr:Crp/Fnr family transcriptional regulator [Catenuloplanes indicus]MDQ0370195.1 CRP-like cAMP-binding protein [Catenuloplanes indicus]
MVTEWPVGTLLDRLRPSARERLLALGVALHVTDDHVLLREGDAGTFVVLLCRALTKVTTRTADDRESLIDIRVSGDLIGEMAALNGGPRSATVTTCGPAQVRIIQRHELQAFLAEHPHAALQLAGLVADQLRRAIRRRVDFAAYPVPVRLARILADLATAHGYRTTAGVALGVQLTQPELAALCGASEVSVHRAMRQLRREGVVRSRYRRITIVDLPSLRHQADLDGQ